MPSDCCVVFSLVALAVIPSVSSDLSAGPNDKTVDAGKNVFFTCSTSSPDDKLIWSKYGKTHTYPYNGISNIISDATKYAVNNDSSGGYELTILNVQISDAASYSCQTSKLTDEVFANLVVISNLTASVSPMTSLAVGDEVNLTCTLTYGAPIADNSFDPLSDKQNPFMNMYIGSSDMSDDAVQTSVIQQQTIVKTWNVNRTLVHGDVSGNFQCTVSSVPGYEMDVEIALNISAPTSSVYIVNNSTSYKIHDEIQCGGDGNPPPVVKWHPIVPGNAFNDGEEGSGWANLHLLHPGNNKWNCSATNNVTDMYGRTRQGQAYQIVDFIVIEIQSTANYSNRLAIGLGVGLGIGLAVIIVLLIIIIILLLKRKRGKASAGVEKAQPMYAFSPTPNPPNYYTTPVMPEQVSQSRQPVVRGSPGVPDLGVRHLGGSKSSLQLNQSFDANEKLEYQPDGKFNGGFADLGQSSSHA